MRSCAHILPPHTKRWLNIPWLGYVTWMAVSGSSGDSNSCWKLPSLLPLNWLLKAPCSHKPALAATPTLPYLTTVKTRIIGPCARTLDLPLLVKSVFFLLFLLPRGTRFLVRVLPFSRGGNFGLHSTWSNYSSFHVASSVNCKVETPRPQLPSFHKQAQKKEQCHPSAPSSTSLHIKGAN